MSQKVLDEQNPSEPKNGRVVVVVAEEGSKVDDGHDKPTVGGDGQAEEHGEKGDRTFVLSSPMEVNSAADSAGGLAEEMGGEAPNGEEKVVGDQRQENAEGEEQPSEGADEVGGGRERTETAQIGTGADGAQPLPEKTPPKLRIHRVFRNEEGFEVRQSETVADTRLVEQYLKMRMLCSREQLWRFAFDDANAEKDFRAMRRRLQKRFKYYENKQKLEVTTKKAAGKRAGEGETAEAKVRLGWTARNWEGLGLVWTARKVGKGWGWAGLPKKLGRVGVGLDCSKSWEGWGWAGLPEKLGLAGLPGKLGLVWTARNWKGWGWSGLLEKLGLVWTARNWKGWGWSGLLKKLGLVWTAQKVGVGLDCPKLGRVGVGLDCSKSWGWSGLPEIGKGWVGLDCSKSWGWSGLPEIGKGWGWSGLLEKLGFDWTARKVGKGWGWAGLLEKLGRQKALIAANNLRPSTSAAVQSPFRPSPPSSSGYSTTTTTSSAPEGKTPPAVGGRHGGRGTARRPNAGTKRQRYSPGAEALNPQQEVRRAKAML
uniref:Uncharacterized protein n=1 Tax=Globodera rostochiensis TaxID=31243 RepID=A0A914GYR7_GLORO